MGCQAAVGSRQSSCRSREDPRAQAVGPVHSDRLRQSFLREDSTRGMESSGWSPRPSTPRPLAVLHAPPAHMRRNRPCTRAHLPCSPALLTCPAHLLGCTCPAHLPRHTWAHLADAAGSSSRPPAASGAPRGACLSFQRSARLRCHRSRGSSCTLSADSVARRAAPCSGGDTDSSGGAARPSLL